MFLTDAIYNVIKYMTNVQSSQRGGLPEVEGGAVPRADGADEQLCHVVAHDAGRHPRRHGAVPSAAPKGVL